MRLYFIVLSAVVVTTFSTSYAEEPAKTESMLDSLERKLELGRHEHLLVQKRNSQNSLSEFSTDGCSGGLSVGWQYLSSKIDRLQTIHGDLPPWESCCITHDRRYHTAGDGDITAEMSFQARREADEQLRACVLDIGISRAPELSGEYDFSEEEVGRVYEVIGELMYRAVRVGGVPCSGLPWRWGYGWPDCN